MSIDYITTDTDLTAIADAIRVKGGTADPLAFPDGFVTAIQNIKAADPITRDPTFANNSWESIIDACQTDDIPDEWLVGDSKSMAINGVDYVIDIIGKSHDSYADGSGKAPLTFQFHRCYGGHFAMCVNQTSYAWDTCEVRTVTLPQLMTLMPKAVRNSIREVSKVTNGITTSDTLFLLSESEIMGTYDNSRSGEGTKYSYYSINDPNNVRIQYFKSIGWWLRSPSKSLRNPLSVSTSTNQSSSTTSTTEVTIVTSDNAFGAVNGISPAFCF